LSDGGRRPRLPPEHSRRQRRHEPQRPLLPLPDRNRAARGARGLPGGMQIRRPRRQAFPV